MQALGRLAVSLEPSDSFDGMDYTQEDRALSSGLHSPDRSQCASSGHSRNPWAQITHSHNLPIGDIKSQSPSLSHPDLKLFGDVQGSTSPGQGSQHVQPHLGSLSVMRLAGWEPDGE
ncbi:hypothetical protein CCUS01_07917 [Colletotrichum cuscutae]|uniref:Uncharacterized protein n=1 Tax=Colletotrichum cuscutae TaxID=1209917 RepID=A0AAI9UTV8_9PEZI|nr:hypothetical protein CCUS01_07917 [Colletotrichum cuscutae]